MAPKRQLVRGVTLLAVTAVAAQASASRTPPSPPTTFHRHGPVKIGSDGVPTPAITNVTVSATPGETLRFAITLANRATLNPNDYMAVYLNSDPTESPSRWSVERTHRRGANYEIYYGHFPTRTGWRAVYCPSSCGAGLSPNPSGGFSAGVMTVAIPRSEIHASGLVRFWIQAAHGIVLYEAQGRLPGLSTQVSDDAPRSGTWRYPPH